MDAVVAAAFVAVAFATTAFGAARLALGSILGLGYGALANGVALSAFFAGRSISATLSGILYDARPGLARRLPGLAVAGVAATLYAMSLSPTPVALAVLSGVQGLLSGLAWPLVQTGVAHRSRGSPTVLSAYFAMGSIGLALGRLAYPTLSAMLGDAGVLAAAAPLYLCSSAALLVGFRGLDLPKARHRSPLRFARAWRSLVLNTASGFNMGVGAQLLYPLLVARAHLDPGLAAYALSAGSLLGIPSKLAAGGLASRLGLRASIAVIAVGSAAGLAGVYAGGAVAAASAAAYLALASAVLPLARLAAYEEGRRLGAPAAVMGASNTFSNIGSTVAPLAYPALVHTLPVYSLPLLAASLLAPGGRDSRR